MSNVKIKKNTNKKIETKKPENKYLPTIIISSFVVLALMIGTIFIKGEYVGVLKVYSTILMAGISCLPLTMYISRTFKEKGVFLSKSIGILINVFILFLLGTLKILKFTSLSMLIVLLAVTVLNYVFIFPKIKNEINKDTIIAFLIEESLFLLFLTMLVYLRGFKNEIDQTEKYMDYGFIMSIYKSEYFPVDDMWMSGRYINYYYFGQVILTYLLKFLKVKPQIGYNIVISVVIALSTINLGSLMFNVGEKISKNIKKSVIFGSLTSIFTFFTANCHYLWYGVIKYIWDKSYIVYDSTRYIGYNPETNDKTIHEFPLYGFLLGDAHAYTINTIFVIGVLALAFAYYFTTHKTKISKYLSPQIILIGFFIGIFQMSNYWDFPIYTVICGCIILLANVKETKCFGKEFWKNTLFITIPQGIEILGISLLTALPFRYYFKMISNEIKLAQNHTLPHQLFVLWGFFAVLFIVFVVYFLTNKKKLDRDTFYIDLTFIVLGLCGLGLVFLPEVIYVKDIYEIGYARANTMFKLTYQAYIMLSISCCYYIYKFLQNKIVYKIIAIIALVILAINTTYTGRYIKKDFGNIFDYGYYKGLDGSRYLISYSQDELNTINWINENIEGRPHILEAAGLSYSKYERISAFTGSITIYGWQTHEELWNNFEEKEERQNAVARIYIGDTIEEKKELLNKYDMDYIYIGPCEVESFYYEMQYDLLESLGEVVYRNNSCRLIKLDKENW